MPIRAGERPGGLGGAAKLVADKASAIVRLELALAASELKQKLVKLGLGIGLVVGAAVFLFFAVGFALATIAAALATFLSTWLALLIVAGGLVLAAALLGAIGARLLSKGSPPVPEQAIAEAKLTTEALKNGHH
ncbi:MAG TPA: phage holin family protein [Gaiellaceae bacterium]|jgi:Putative Actinobacterial Holin-X, holin superfamily III|nr:phage holin family protein [Gaiellaceae bacterium]